MNKKLMSLLVTILLAFSFISCSSKEKEEVKNSTPEASQENVDIKTIINGGTYLKDAAITDNEAAIEYQYIDDAGKQYFETGDKTDKILMEDPYRVIRNISNVEKVTVFIHGTDKASTVEVTKSELEDFAGVKIEQIKSSDDWRSQIINKIFTEQKRSEFLSKYKK